MYCKKSCKTFRHTLNIYAQTSSERLKISLRIITHLESTAVLLNFEVAFPFMDFPHTTD